MSSSQAAYRGLRRKFITSISIVLTLTLAGSAFYVYEEEKTLLDQGLQQKARSIGEFIALISPEAIYSFDITTLDRFVQQIGEDEDIHHAEIRNPGGEPLTTWQHSMAGTLGHHDNHDRFASLTFPISEGNEQLGSLHIVVDTQRIRKLNRDNLIKLLVIDASIILLLAVMIYLIFYYTVLGPVNRLINGSKEISDGNLDHRVSVTSNDELGQLAQSFNDMAIDIEKEQMALLQANQQLAREIQHSEAVANELRLSASVFTHAREGIIITDPKSRIIDVNEAFTRITGYNHDEAVGKNPRFLKSHRHDRQFYASLWKELVSTGHWTGELWNRTKSGDLVAVLLTISSVCNEAGDIMHYVALFTDITRQKQQQSQLEQMAHYDALTGLPNRVLLADRLQQAFAGELRKQSGLTVAYIDLDGFKAINDEHGHEIGDQLLIKVARQMSNTLRGSDTLARLGGDEFVIIINQTKPEGSLLLIRRLLEAVAEPVSINNSLLTVSASIGVTFYPQADVVDADQLLRQADQAMYQAKLRGKNQYYVFDPEHDRNLRGHQESVERLQQALSNDEFTLFYQPKVNLQSGEVIGAEALLRWQHPERGLVAPGEFLYLLENHPLSIDLGQWVISSALQQLRQWHRADLKLTISVNLSAFHLQSRGFTEWLALTISEFPDIDSSFLELEILETSTLDIAVVAEIMRDIKRLGIEFALDDFGTGYSSLTYLKKLPAKVLKVDQSFIRDMLEDPEDLAIVEGVLGLATAFQRTPVAEGVETLEHAEMLLLMGCKLAQGYAIARPMPAEQLPDWTERWQPEPEWHEMSGLESANMKLIFAMVEHHAWCNRVRQFVNKESETLPQPHPNQYLIMDWLANDDSSLMQDPEKVDQLRAMHSQLHLEASKISRLLEQGHTEKVRDLIDPMSEQCGAMGSALKSMLLEARRATTGA